MKITKSRLLQIIREEVELHEKNIIELDENELAEEADENNDGQISKEEANKIFNAEERKDKRTGRLHVKLNKKKPTEEDMLFTKEKPHKVIEPRKTK